MNNLSIAYNDVKASNTMVCDEPVVWIDFSASQTLPHINGRRYARSLSVDRQAIEVMFLILAHVRERSQALSGVRLLTRSQLPINKGVSVADANLLPLISSSDITDGPYQYLFRPDL